MTVLRNSLARCNARHLRIKRLVQFIFVGPVYNNALKDRAALLCRACLDEITCVAVRYLTLRTGCSRGRTPKVVRPQQRKNPLPFPFSQRSHVGNLRQTIQGKGVIHKRVETAVFQKQFPFNYTKSSKVEQKYSISPLKCLQSVILKSEVSIMQCKGSTKSTVSGRFKIIVAEISGVICGVKIQVAAAANMK